MQELLGASGVWSDTPVHVASSTCYPSHGYPRVGALTKGRICTLLILLWSAVRGIPYRREKIVCRMEIKGDMRWQWYIRWKMEE